MPAKAKLTTNKTMIDLAKQVKAKHALIQRESDEVDTLKAQLTELARAEFFDELKCKTVAGKPTEIIKGVPAVYGNIEVPVENNDKVTINFQMGSKTFSKIDKKPAHKVLRGIFGKDFDKVFAEAQSHDVIATLKEQDEQAAKPGFFGYSIRPDADTTELAKLYADRPDLFARSVTDLEGYAKTYPRSVETTTKVKLVSGFIEKVGKMDSHVLENAKNFLAGLFEGGIRIVVKCGNANKKK